MQREWSARKCWTALVVTAGMLCGLVQAASATDYVWRVNGPSDDWFNSSNWTPTGVPGASDTALVVNDDPIVSTPTTVGTLYLDGTLRNENLTVLNAMVWTAGSIRGSLTIAPSATLSIEGTGDVFVIGTLNNNGTVVKSGTGTMRGNGGTINNAGTWRFAAASGIYDVNLTFNNTGSMVKDTSDGETTVYVNTLANSGRITANTGTLRLLRGGGAGIWETAAGTAIELDDYSFSDGASVVGAGSVASDGQASVVGSLFIGSGAVFKLIGGTLSARNALLHGGGLWEWRGGILDGELTTDSDVNAVFGGSLPRTLQGTLNLRGTTHRYLPSGSWTFNTGSTLNNYGVYTIQDAPVSFNNLSISRQAGSGQAGSGQAGSGQAGSGQAGSGQAGSRQSEATAPGSAHAVQPRFNNNVVNYGTFNILTDAATSIPHTNRGIFNVSDNFQAGGGYTQASGTTLLAGGNLTASIDITGGTLAGAGTVIGSVTNGGVLAPGRSLTERPIGTLRIEGDYTQLATGALNVELAGTSASSTSDALQVTQRANLAGVLNVAPVNGFAPLSGQRFKFLTYALHLGQFARLNAASLGKGRTYGVEYGDTVAQLLVRAAPSITALSPRAGFTSTSLTIVGANLSDVTQVLFGAAAGTISRREANRVVVTIPPDAVTGRVRVVNPSGSVVSAQAFAVLPRIVSFSPSFGDGAGGTSTSIAGSGFTQVSSVSIGGVRATFTRISSRLLRATIPLTARTGRIVVQTLGGSTTSATNFVVVHSPSSFSVVEVNAPKAAPLSTVVADAATSSLTLRFVGRSPESVEADLFHVRIDGEEEVIESVCVKGSSLTIGFPAGALHTGDRVEVTSDMFGDIVTQAR